MTKVVLDAISEVEAISAEAIGEVAKITKETAKIIEQKEKA